MSPSQATPRPARIRFAPALLALLAAACGTKPLPPIVAPPLEVPQAPPTPPPAAARWIESGGATIVGPVVGDVTVVLLGGRRATVAKDGAVRMQTAEAPEPIAELVQVPTAQGLRLVGRGEHGIYRFDDPLGEAKSLAHSDPTITRIGAGPGLVAVWTVRSDLPRFIGADDGEPRTNLRLPEPPLRALAFLDENRGAGVFEAVGLAITSDGGASWKVASDTTPGEALRASGLRRRGDALRAFAFADGPEGAIDLAAGRLGALSAAVEAQDDAPLLRWVRATGRDPLEAAAAMGVDAPAGGALIAGHGLVARVDPRTGAFSEIAEFARGKWMNPCHMARSGKTAWVACTLSEDRASDLYDPFGVLRVPLGDGPIKLENAEILRNGEVELRVSPSGGAMLLGPCKNDDDGQACVRLPDGKWKSVSSDTDLSERGAGALADGRIAFLRGVFDGDHAADGGDPQASPPGPGDDEGAKNKRLHVAVLDASGKESVYGPINFTMSRGYVRVQSPIEEEADKSLHLVIEDGEGPFAVTLSPGRDPATVQKIADAATARIHAGRGIAVGEGHVLASLDGGGSWNEVPTTPRVLEVLGELGSSYDDPGTIVVSDVGAKIGSMLRLGWGPPDPGAAPERRRPGGVELDAPRAQPSGPDQVLTCKSEGPSQAAAPLVGTSQIKALLASRPPAKGTRRETSQWSPGRSGMLETVAILEEQGPDAAGSTPAAWSLRWHDPQELGGRARTANVKPPKDAKWGSTLRFAASAGARAIFAIRTAGKHQLVRVKAGGGTESIEVASELMPSGDVVFGGERGEAIAWVHDTRVVVWLAGETPRAIASISTHPVRALGEPTRDGVPLLLGSNDWSILRVLPIPAMDKQASKPPPPAPPALDGWTRAPAVRRDLGALPACTAKAKGARFSLARSSMHATIDGIAESGYPSIYEVRVSGAEACVASITATLTPERRGASAPPAGNKPKGPAPAGPAAFVRADVASKRAEGGDRGVPPAAVRRMSCSLGPRQ